MLEVIDTISLCSSKLLEKISDICMVNDDLRILLPLWIFLGFSISLSRWQILMISGIVAFSFTFSKTSIHFCWKSFPIISSMFQKNTARKLGKFSTFFCKKFAKTFVTFLCPNTGGLTFFLFWNHKLQNRPKYIHRVRLTSTYLTLKVYYIHRR